MAQEDLWVCAGARENHLCRRKSNLIKLYLVVQHPKDPSQPQINQWIDDERLGAIKTTPEIAELCKAAKSLGDSVLVHRCAWGSAAHTIICSVRVLRVYVVDRSTALVRFTDARPLNLTPPRLPAPGQNFYVAP
jgi:hypothetical protein